MISQIEDFVVEPRSWASIEQESFSLREQLGYRFEPYIPIDHCVEIIMVDLLDLFVLEIKSFDEMQGAEGLTYPDGSGVVLREDVYRKLCNDDARARFTLAHELGHWVLHSGRPYRRASGLEEPFRRSEPQANQFAASFLMPQSMISRFADPADLVDQFGVSLESAENRIDSLLRRGLI